VGKYEWQALAQDLYSLRLTVPKVRGKYFEFHVRAVPSDFVNAIAEMARAAVRQIIAVYAGNHQVSQLHLLDHPSQS